MTMTSRFSMTEMSLEEARAKRDRFDSRMPVGSPLRYRPVVVAGPNDGYFVTEIGIATREEWPIIK